LPERQQDVRLGESAFGLDPATFIGRAPYGGPALPSIGIQSVLVNGKIALSDGAATGLQGGRALLRGPNTPSRPMKLGGRISAEFRSPDVPIDIDITQVAGARSASGRLTFAPNAPKSLVATRLGVLQAGDGWASVTGVGTIKDGTERAFVATFDLHDTPRSLVTMTLVIEGEQPYRGAMTLRSLTVR